MARLFTRSNAQKLLDLRASEADVRSGSLAARVTVIEDVLDDVDIVDLKDRLELAEPKIEDHETRIADLETRVSDLEPT